MYARACARAPAGGCGGRWGSSLATCSAAYVAVQP